MKNIAVVLSGCGVMDGSEIHEAVATLLAIDRAGASYQCVAPNIQQTRVMNHFTQEATTETRNVLVESARIARGVIKDLNSVNITEFDAAIYPGGYGAALNLCDFAISGANHSLEKNVLHFAQAMAKAGKPQGFICIAPALIAKIYGPGVTMTIGNDSATIKTMEQMGNHHQQASVNEVIVDRQHKVVSTPAYMLGKNISEVFNGINHLVNQVMAICH